MSESLVDWGLDRVTAGDWLDGVRQARVVRVDRGECDVITPDGRVRVLSDSQRAQGEIAPVTGDWVEIDDTEGLGTVIARVLPRRTAVSRRDPAEKDLEQVLASNVDVVAAVLGLDRPVQAGWLERLLVMAIDSGAEPLIVLTKADEADVDTLAFSIVEAVAGSVPMIVTSIVDRTGLDELLARIGSERTLALVGESGVGKSSIVNALVGEARLDVGEVRTRDAGGRHTTTARELIRLPDDAGLILDTPGIRMLGLWEAEHALDLVFGDLVDLAQHCRFRDCAHRGEPGCAVQAAIDTGWLSAMRVRLFLELVDELDDLRKREEQRARWEKGGGRRQR